MGSLRSFGKKGQSGQSLVILAIGFLALLGFVGIVTDVSVLFIRYSTMRRAVDAAAIAAAGQMRRVADPSPGTVLEGGNGLADDEAISVANLNLAARQFIEVYGLNPKSVVVETCRAQQIARDPAGNPYDAEYYLDPPTNTVVNPNAHRLFNNDGTDNYNDGTSAPEPDANPDVIARYKQLCTRDELKLVRVTAQIDSPTIFLRLLGYPTVTLTESATSQTAVIDVVMIFDVSESMLNQTTYADWDTLTPKQGVIYMPPFVDPNDVWDRTADLLAVPPVAYRQNPWTFIADRSESAINPYISPTLPTSDSRYDQFQDTTIRFEPNGSSSYQQWVQDGTNTVTVDGVPHAVSNQARIEPREFCQVRAYPSSSGIRSFVNPDLRQQYYDFFTSSAWLTANPTETYARQFTGNQGTYRGGVVPPSSTSSALFSGFVPMYNYYGCCNDPNGDFYFDDLICQPFKQARDAAHSFLDRLDFLRGDRVGYVTFNRQAYMVDPDGADIYDSAGNLLTAGGPQSLMIETQNNIPVDPLNPAGALLRKGADETLDDVIGVMAERSNYADTNNNGVWDALMDGGAAKTYQQLQDSVIGEMTNNPVNGACPDDRALLSPFYLSSNSNIMPDGTDRKVTGTALLEDVITVPDWYRSSGIPSASPSIPANYNSRARSYENRASCAGTNIGGALAAGSAELFNEGRRQGAVWIMVMLSDGAAGASNPITKIGVEAISGANPYAVDGSGHLSPLDGIGGPICTDPTNPNYPCTANTTGGYGFFGLCPYGSQAQPGQVLLSEVFPTCGDLQPETRHYCGTISLMPNAALDGDLGGAAGCINTYDVDDYARDWADWIAVADLPGAASGGTTGRVGDQLLPTIFTIGFGINYDVDPATDTHTVCGANDYACIRGLAAAAGETLHLGRNRARNADYLGEELLRYIADAGDNFAIDNDYWQTSLGTRIGFNITSPEWGNFGACETTTSTHTGAWNPAPPRQSCGNYYVAATGQQLEDVFNQIASRMFTRLSQ